MEETISDQMNTYQPPQSIYEAAHAQGSDNTKLFDQQDETFFADPTIGDNGMVLPEDGGIFLYKFGAIPTGTDETGRLRLMNIVRLLYPTKSAFTTDDVIANNVIKRVLVSQIRFLAKNPLSALLLLRKKTLESWLKEFYGIGWTVMGSHLLADNRYCLFNRELRKFIETFFIELGFTGELVWRLPKIFITMFEYDDIYRYRVQDTLSETTTELLLAHPAKEIQRLLAISDQRDLRQNTIGKFRAFGRIIRLALLIPRFKKAFTRAIRSIDVTKLHLDEADRYHVLKYKNYDFLGESSEVRWERYLKLHDGNPPSPVVIGNQQSLQPTL